MTRPLNVWGNPRNLDHVPTSEHYTGANRWKDRIGSGVAAAVLLTFVGAALAGCTPAPQPVVACNAEGTFCLSGTVEVTP